MNTKLRNKISLSLGFAAAAILFCGPARAESWGGDSNLPLADRVATWIGYSGMTGDQRDLLALSVYVFAAVFGVATRVSLRDLAFGAFLNGVFGAVGVCLALYAFGPRFHLMPQMAESMRFNITLIACGASAGLMLLVAAVAKKFGSRYLGQFVDLFGRPEKPKLFEVEEELPPRVATALRKN